MTLPATAHTALPLPLGSGEAGLPPAARHALVGGVLAAHLVAAWGLLQIEAVRQAAAEVAPLFVSLVAPPAPKPEPPPPPPPPQAPRPRPMPKPRPIVAAAPSPAPTPATFSVPAPPPEPPAPEPVAVVQAPVAPAAPPVPAPPPPAPPAPLSVPPTAVRYIVPPEPAYPSASRRLGESGEVRLRVEIGTDGRARQVSVQRGSGHPRLDDSAVAAVRAARFAPYTDNGVARVVWTIVPIVFELEN